MFSLFSLLASNLIVAHVREHGDFLFIIRLHLNFPLGHPRPKALLPPTLYADRYLVYLPP